MQKHYNFPTLGVKGLAQPPAEQSHTISPPPTNWHNAVRQVTSSWRLPNSDSPIRLASSVLQVYFITPQNWFPQLQSPVLACFTPLHLTLGIVFGDVRLACSCSAVETYSMKFHTVLNCVDIKASGSSKLSSSGISRALLTFMHHAP